MAQVAELVFKAQTQELEKAKGVLGELKTKTEEAADSASKLERSMSLASKAGIAIGTAIAGGLTALVASTKAGIDYADSINELSQRAMVGTEALSGWAYGAKLAGVSQEELGSALTKLNSIMDDAWGGNEKASAMFDRLGVSVEDAGGNLKSTETVFLDVADAFSKLDDNASKASIASDMFGKSVGPALIPFLNQGREGLEKLNTEALKFGLIITKEVAEGADAFNDRLDMLKGQTKGVSTQIAAGLLPTLNNLGEIFIENVNKTGMVADITKVADVALRGLASAAVIAYNGFKILWQGLSSVGGALWAIFHGDIDGAKEALAQGWKDIKLTAETGWATLERVNDEGAAKSAANAPKRTKALAKPVTDAKDKVKKEVDEIAEYLKKLESLVDPLYKYKQELNTIAEAEKRQGADLQLLAQRRDMVTEAMFKALSAETEEEKAIRTKNEALQQAYEKYAAIADPLRQYDLQLQEIHRLMQEATADQAMLSAAEEQVIKNREKAAAKLKKNGEEQDDMMKSLIAAAEGYGKSMSDAMVGWMAGTKTSFSDMVRTMIMEMAKLLMYQAIFKPMTKSIMGYFGFNNGGVFSGGSPTAFADGMINSPTFFPMANGGTGLAGESGSEAIMPLRRDATGRLGIDASGGGKGFSVDAININISNVTEKDSPAVSKAAQDGVDRAVRGLIQSEIFSQMRLGNSFNPIPLKGF